MSHWTAAALARELGVSRRTVLRDLGGLREAGFDLATFSGPGGGVRLNPTSIMITSQLRASEVVALIVSVEIARAAKTVRHRLNPGGDRQANHALYRIVITRLSSHPATRAYAGRRTKEGLSKKEIIRCLKRYVAREVYPHLRPPAG